MSNSSFLAMKWAIFASVPEEADLDKFREFGEWMSEELRKAAPRLGIFVYLEQKPSVVQWIQPGNFDAVVDAYECLDREHPGVQFVLHILPQQGAEEYYWMKTLSQRFGIIRQGVLAENALCRFGSLPSSTEGTEVSAEEALANMAQWIQRRSTEIARGKTEVDRPFDLHIRIGEGEEEGGNGDSESPSRQKLPRGLLSQAAIGAVVNEVLLKVPGSEEPSLDPAVRVSGLPSGMTDFWVSGLFHPLHVVHVKQNPEQLEAIVTLANKFHAFQAAEKFHEMKIDRYHKMEVHLLSPVQT